MIPLRGRVTASLLTQPLDRHVWRLAAPAAPLNESGVTAVLCDACDFTPQQGAIHVLKPGLAPHPAMTGWLELPPELRYLAPGDVIGLTPDCKQLRVLFRHDSRHNPVLLTERCDNYCLMCSQPPKDRLDDWLLHQAAELLEALPKDTPELLFTGGEPTLYGARFNDLLRLCTELLPQTAVHILTNGRRFADAAFAEDYADVKNPNLMVGIPVYGSEAALHDYIVQAPGAFRETIQGILNLAELGQAVEIRVVVQKHTAPVLVDIAEFIARNLTFVDQVALMGLEMIGLARPNQAEVWIDPYEYRSQLREATLLLASHGIRTLIYNHQLCVIPQDIWPFAVKSISDWKNEYDPICGTCEVVDACGGFFYAASYRASSHIQPVRGASTTSIAKDSALARDVREWRAGSGSCRQQAR